MICCCADPRRKHVNRHLWEEGRNPCLLPCISLTTDLPIPVPSLLWKLSSGSSRFFVMFLRESWVWKKASRLRILCPTCCNGKLFLLYSWDGHLGCARTQPRDCWVGLETERLREARRHLSLERAIRPYAGHMPKPHFPNRDFPNINIFRCFSVILWLTGICFPPDPSLSPQLHTHTPHTGISSNQGPFFCGISCLLCTTWRVSRTFLVYLTFNVLAC